MGTDWAYRVDFIALVGLFAGGVFGLRYLSEWLVPNFIVVNGRFYDACRWVFGVLTGYVTIGFLLMAMHTAPLPRDFLGFTPERNNFFGQLAPDRDWLGFVQYVSEKSMPSSEEGRIFDGSQFRLPGHTNRSVADIYFPLCLAPREHGQRFGRDRSLLRSQRPAEGGGGGHHPTAARDRRGFDRRGRHQRCGTISQRMRSALNGVVRASRH